MTDLRPGAFNGVRALVTGHTGFKGGWLSGWLRADGAEVAGLALPPEEGQPSLFHDLKLESGMASRYGDIRDLATVEAAMSEFAPEIIFHLAAQALVRRAYADPVATFATNVMGTVHVLDAARRSPSVKAIVCVTSDKCYDNQEWVWGYRESDPLGGKDPYSASKAAAEIAAGSYRQALLPAEIALATARGGNVIGGGDWSTDRLIPDLIRGFISNEPVRIRSPRAIRPWQHVLEPLRGYILLAENLLRGDPRFATAFNFGPFDDDTRPVGWIADRLVTLWGNGARWIHEEDTTAHEANFLKLDASRAHAELNWRPRLRLAQALDWLIDWYKAYQEGADMQRVTIEQIVEYESLPSVD